MEEERDRGLSTSESLSALLLYSFGILSAIRGAFWLSAGSSAVHDFDMYAALASIAPLRFWGVLILSSGLVIMISAYLLPKRRRTNSFFYALLVGGFVASVVYFAVAVAGISQAQNWMTPLQIILLSASHGMLAFIGGANVWNKRNMNMSE